MGKTIKNIELITFIANQEYDKLPEKIIYSDCEWELKYDDWHCDYWNDGATYITEFVDTSNPDDLNAEVEIIEEYKIEKLDEEDAYRDPNNIVHTWSEKEAILVRKINELIDEHERMIKEK